MSPAANENRERRVRRGIGEYTPFLSMSSQDEDENEWWLRREISLIENLLRGEGEMAKGEIGDRLGCKYWGRCASAAPSRKASSGGRSARPAGTATRPSNSRPRVTRAPSRTAG